MEREKPNKQNEPGKKGKEGYVVVPNYFLRKWVKVLGIGPALLYLQLLSYCHKEKDIAWPTLTTLSNKLAISKNSLLSYRKTLLKYGLIKKIIKRRTVQGNYQSNFYKVTPIEGGAKIEPRQVQILGEGSANIAPGVVQNLHPNNTNLKHYQGNNNKEGENAVVAVNFKKLKEKGEERMQAIRERMVELDFKEEFIEQLLKDYPPRNIEKKLDLLLIKRNIQNPAGWLMSALKNDYQDPEQDKRGLATFLNDTENMEEEKSCLSPFIPSDSSEHSNLVSTSEWTSREKALKAIKLIKDNLSLPVYPSSPLGKGP